MEEVKLFVGNTSVDDRGSVSFVNSFEFKGVKRFYTVENHEVGFIRAWHGHQKEGKYVYVPHGAAMIVTVPMGGCDFEKFTLSEKVSQILWIPPGYYNGFKTLKPDTKIIFFSTSTLEESKDDDFRRPWNDFDGDDVWSDDYR